MNELTYVFSVYPELNKGLLNQTTVFDKFTLGGLFHLKVKMAMSPMNTSEAQYYYTGLSASSETPSPVGPVSFFSKRERLVRLYSAADGDPMSVIPILGNEGNLLLEQR